MTKAHKELSPAGAALRARVMLTAATEVLSRNGFDHIRFDQWENPKTSILVETGYTYGETRLTVHRPGETPYDFRLTGRSQAEYDEFKVRAGV